MYKSTSRFMQGDWRRNPISLDRQENREKAKRRQDRGIGGYKPTKSERRHLAIGSPNEAVFQSTIQSFIHDTVQQGTAHSAEQAASLNRAGIKTAAGGQWTVRLIVLFHRRTEELQRASRPSSNRLFRGSLKRRDVRIALLGTPEKRKKEKEQRKRAKAAAEKVVIERRPKTRSQKPE